MNLEAVKFNDFKKELENTDIAIFSTSSKDPIITSDELTRIQENSNKDLLIVDLSVPRNITSECYEIPGIKIVNVDNLKDIVNLNYKKRRSEVVKAERYIDDFLQDFDDWTNSRQLRPSILSLKKQIKEIVIDETIDNVKSSNCDCSNSKFDSSGLNKKLNKVYEKFSDNLIRKIKEASNNGKDENAIGIINKIFLDD